MGITYPLAMQWIQMDKTITGGGNTRLYGGQPYSADGTKVTYNSDAGVKALQFGSNSSGRFKRLHEQRSRRFHMIIDGSFRISTFKKQEGLNFAISELPGHAGKVILLGQWNQFKS